MSVAALKQYTLRAKYARYNKKAMRRESYAEATNRVRNMMLGLFPQVEEPINWAYDLALAQRILGSQRALQFGGKPALQHNARIYNCCSSYCDRLRFFQETLYLLLCGCGTGFSVQNHHIAHLPAFAPHRLGIRRKCPTKTFVVPDNIEGWADALGVLLSSYFENPVFGQYYGYDVDFQYYLIRPEGSYLSSGAGKAPGPEPLRQALEKIRKLLDKCLRNGQSRLRPIDAYDIVMHASDAVLAGGVRRSATICIFSLGDEEMMKAKTGNWMTENPQRARSNNSVLLLRDKTTYEQFYDILQHTKEYGEPGFYWSDSTEQLPNPCFSADTLLATDEGLRSIGDLYQAGKPINVVVDTRIDGLTVKQATPVRLTQTQAALYELTTEHGHVLHVTGNHEFPTTFGKLRIDQMLEGTPLLLPSSEGIFGTSGTYNEGLVLGLITGDGCICGQDAFIDVWPDDYDQLDNIQTIVNSMEGEFQWVDQSGHKKRIGGCRLYRFLKNTLGINEPKSLKQHVPDCVLRGSREFVKGYLQGLMFCDGTVNLNEHKHLPTFSWRLNRSNPKLLRQVQILLGQFGVVSRLNLRRYELIINRPNAILARDKIGSFGRQTIILDHMIDYCGRSCRKPEKYITKVVSIKFHSVADVYCLTEPDTNTVIANGIVAGQCVEIGFNPTLQIAANSNLLRDYRGPIRDDGCDSQGRPLLRLSGWQFCNLSTINGQMCTTPELFYEDCRGAAIIGSVQAAMTTFEYLGSVTEAIVRREALLGVSITGVMDSPKVLLDPQVLRVGAQIVLKTNEEMTTLLGTNPCARGTCLKPEGTSSCLLGTASGASPWKFKRGFRRVQANRNEAVAQFFAMKNPWAVEKSKWCANGTTNVITFCLEAPEGAIIEGDMTAVEFLDVVRLIQDNWVQPGKRHECCTQPWLTNNVSNTVVVKPHEWDDVIAHIYKYRESYAGISLLPHSGDKDYPQAPFTAVYNPEEIKNEYGEQATQHGEKLLAKALDLYDDIWEACNDVLRKGNKPFIVMCESFAEHFFHGDVKRVTYLIKDLYNWRHWEYLQAYYQDVNYDEFIETDGFTTFSSEVACAGGVCAL